jgi:hypothetical protein
MVSIPNPIKKRLGKINAIPVKYRINERKNGLRETENIPVVISFPRFVLLRPKRSEVLKCTSVMVKKISDTRIKTAPAVFKIKFSEMNCVMYSGRIDNVNRNADFVISNSQANRIIIKTG